jgi:hypothetical protein
VLNVVALNNKQSSIVEPKSTVGMESMISQIVLYFDKVVIPDPIDASRIRIKPNL